MPQRPPSDLKRVTAQYHAAVQSLTENALADLQGRWQGVQATLDLKIKRLTDQIAEAEARGETVNVAWLTQAQRLEQLRAAVQGDVSAFADGAADIVQSAIDGATDLGQAAAQAALAATVPPGVNFTFGVPPSDVAEELAAALQPGSPLAALFGQLGPQVAAFAQQALFTGVALGEGPRQIAQRLEWATNMAARRAEVIARTETLRAWRHAQFANYQANSDVVQQWMWAADFGPRCCGACIAMDGTFHGLDTELDDHICGRCSAIPITRPWSEILAGAGMSQSEIDALDLTETSGLAWAQSRESGESWLQRQSVEVQNQILGLAKAEAWRQGAFPLERVVGVVHDPQWGSSIRELSLRQMGIDAQVWLQAARAAGNDSILADEEALAAAHAETSVSVATEQRAEQVAQAKAAADEWYAAIERSIAEGRAGGLTAEEAKAAADEWFAQVSRNLPPGGLSEADIARAMERRFGMVANPAAIEAEVARAEQMLTSQELRTVAGSAPQMLAETAYQGPSAAYEREVTEALRVHVEDYAALHPEMTLEEYRTAVNARLQELVDGALPSIRQTPDALAQILRDGQYKSVHEIGSNRVASGDMTTYVAERAAYEEQVFGYSVADAEREAPIYGYLTASGQDDVIARIYGDARVMLHPAVMDRASVTFADSMADEGRVVPRPADAMRYDAYEFPSYGGPLPAEWDQATRDFFAQQMQMRDPLNWNSLADYTRAAMDQNYTGAAVYAEAQIHGGVSIADIQRVIFNGEQPPIAELTNMLDAAGIPWSHEPYSLNQAFGIDESASAPIAAEAETATAAQNAEGIKDFGDPISNVFQQPLSDADIAKLVGASEKDAVNVEEIERGVVQVNVTTPRHEAAFEFSRDERGRLIATGDVQTDEDARGFASGRDVIGAMGQMNNLGVNELQVEASREGASNGYETWARLGFTGDIPPSVIEKAQAEFGSDVTRVEQLMQLPGGSRWWRANGETWNAAFDFTPGSYSRSVFDPLAARLGVTLTDAARTDALSVATDGETGNLTSAITRETLSALYDQATERAAEKAARLAANSLWSDAQVAETLNALPVLRRVMKGFQDIGMTGAELQSTYQNVSSGLLAEDFYRVMATGQAHDAQQTALLEAARQVFGWRIPAQSVSTAYQPALPALRQFVRALATQLSKAAK